MGQLGFKSRKLCVTKHRWWYESAKHHRRKPHLENEQHGDLAGRGFAANVATGLLVVAASKFGLPVWTTHVSVGTIFGLGSVSGDADWTAVWQIVLSWVLTLPIAAV